MIVGARIGLALGQYVNFWSSQWASQVTGGDFQANPSFKGYAIPAATPIALCDVGVSRRVSGGPGPATLQSQEASFEILE